MNAMSAVINNVEAMTALISTIDSVREKLNEQNTTLAAAYDAAKEEWTDSKSTEFEKVLSSIISSIAKASKDLEVSASNLNTMKNYLENYLKVSLL